MTPHVPGPRPHSPHPGQAASAWLQPEPSLYPSCRLEPHAPGRGLGTPSWEDLLGRR